MHLSETYPCSAVFTRIHHIFPLPIFVFMFFLNRCDLNILKCSRNCDYANIAATMAAKSHTKWHPVWLPNDDQSFCHIVGIRFEWYVLFGVNQLKCNTYIQTHLYCLYTLILTLPTANLYDNFIKTNCICQPINTFTYLLVISLYL